MPGGLTTRFQPIVSLHTSRPAVLALEALTRGPSGSRFERADALFAHARQCNLEAEVDRACIATALETVQQYGLTQDLFLNIHPETLRRDRGFPLFASAVASRCGVAMNRLTFELVERGRNMVDGSIRAALGALTSAGSRIALDDFGGGLSDHAVLRQCEPDFVKIDGELLRAARRSSAERQLLDSVVRACAGRGASVIAEGIEDVWDLEIASRGGITLAQGYFLGRPMPAAAIADGWLAAGAAAGSPA